MATTVTPGIHGYPVAGDFDGDGIDDLGTYQNGNFFLVLGPGFAGAPITIPLSSPGVLNRPVTADMDMDGIDDLGLWVPYSGAGQGTGEWRFLLSDDLLVSKRLLGSANTLNHAYSPTPLGVDLAFHYGDPVALPLVGNFDPPVAASSASSASSSGSGVSGSSSGSSNTTTNSSTSSAPVTQSNASTPSTLSNSAGSSTVSAQQARTLVAALYRDILGRSPDAWGWSYYADKLLQGATSQSIAQEMLTSTEYYGRIVDGVYATYLHRQADAGGRADWLEQMRQGMSEDELAARFLTSAEYTSQHASNAAFVDGLYRDILGRDADAFGRTNYLAELAAGKSRSEIANSILNSAERDRRVVNQAYSQILHRGADPSGLQSYAAKFSAPTYTPGKLELELLASDEYFARVYGGR